MGRSIVTRVLVVVLVVGGFGCVAFAASDGPEPPTHDEFSISAPGHKPTRTFTAERPTRHPVLSSSVNRVTAFMLVPLAMSVLFSTLIGRRRRRVGDVGEAWRRLLFRAPPEFA